MRKNTISTAVIAAAVSDADKAEMAVLGAAQKAYKAAQEAAKAIFAAYNPKAESKRAEYDRLRKFAQEACQKEGVVVQGKNTWSNIYNALLILIAPDTQVEIDDKRKQSTTMFKAGQAESVTEIRAAAKAVREKINKEAGITDKRANNTGARKQEAQATQPSVFEAFRVALKDEETRKRLVAIARELGFDIVPVAVKAKAVKPSTQPPLAAAVQQLAA